MISFIVVGLGAFMASGLTLYSGFGLGTLLMPVFALFFPVEVAVAATAAVHGANNAFKIGVVGKYADRSLVLRFGVPALIAAFGGAAALGYVSHFDAIATYSIGERTAVITPIKLIMGTLIFVFALFELLPVLRKLGFGRRYLALGGVLSGFFGGLSGHQGALRSAFLLKVGITTEAFVGTNAVIGFMVDFARLTIYAAVFYTAGTTGNGPLAANGWQLVLTGILAAFCGVVVGKKYLHKVTMKTVQTIAGILLLGISLLLVTGLI